MTTEIVTVNDNFPCQHFKEKLGNRWLDKNTKVAVFKCQHPDHKETTIDNCKSCKDVLAFDLVQTIVPGVEVKIEDEDSDADKSDKVINPETANKRMTNKTHPVDLLVNRDGVSLDLSNLYAGCSGFLVLAGPSFNTLDVSKLNQRGIVTMGVNNSPCTFKPNIWTYGDPGKKFHPAIWYDPSILKIIPVTRFNEWLRIKLPNGKFELLRKEAKTFPNVIGYRRNADFNPTENWLWEPTVNMGNGKKEAEKNGYPRTLNIMFIALRLFWYLGIKKVFLLGCDFRMEHNKQNYSFGQERTLDAVGSNNAGYYKVKEMLTLIKPYFDKFGYEIYNCYKQSSLKLFPYIPYEKAIEEAIKNIPKVIDASGWYEDKELKIAKEQEKLEKKQLKKHLLKSPENLQNKEIKNEKKTTQVIFPPNW